MSYNVHIPTPGWWREDDPYRGSSMLATYQDNDMMNAVESRVGVTRHKPRGWLYPTEYHLSVSTVRGRPGEISFSPWKITYDNYGNLIWYRAPNLIYGYIYTPSANLDPLPITSNMVNKAVTKALLNLKNQKVNLGVALGEFRETAGLVGDVFQGIANSYQALKHGNIGGALDTLVDAYKARTHTVSKSQYRNTINENRNKLPSDWLQWQYAVKPLIQDVNGACIALSKRSDPPSWVTTVRGTVKTSDRVETNLDTSDLNLYSCDSSVERSSGVFVRLDYIPDNTFFSTLSSLGVTNPLAVAYELVPYSFVVDWAYGIGDWLNLLDATLGYTFLSGSLSKRTEVMETVKSSGRPLNWRPFYARDPSPCVRDFSCRRRRLTLDRIPYSATPFPPPVYKNPVSLTHVANALSLMTGNPKGKSLRI